MSHLELSLEFGSMGVEASREWQPAEQRMNLRVNKYDAAG
jgi:hypothetical protein